MYWTDYGYTNHITFLFCFLTCIEQRQMRMIDRSDGTLVPWQIPRAPACCGHMAPDGVITKAITSPTCIAFNSLAVSVFHLVLLVLIVMAFVLENSLGLCVLCGSPPPVCGACTPACAEPSARTQTGFVAPFLAVWRLSQVSTSPRVTSIIWLLSLAILVCPLSSLISRSLRYTLSASSAPNTLGKARRRCLVSGSECAVGVERAEGALPAHGLPSARPLTLLQKTSTGTCILTLGVWGAVTSILGAPMLLHLRDLLPLPLSRPPLVLIFLSTLASPSPLRGRSFVSIAPWTSLF